MPRPPQEIGTYGKITTKQLPSGKWEAWTRFRMADGSYTEVTRRRGSKTAAEAAVKQRCKILAAEVRGDLINADSRVAHIAELYEKDIEQNARLGEGATSTAQRYGYQLKNWIVPKVGQLTARELQYSVKTIEKLLEHVREVRGYATAKSVRAVLSGLCAFAIRHNAMTINPVRSAKKISGAEEKDPETVSAAQREDVIVKLRAFAKAKQVDKLGRPLGGRADFWSDLPDLVEGMLATGGRLGELLAQDGADVNTAEKEITLGHHIVRVRGEGLVRVPGRKGGKPALTLGVPEWSMPMWRRRKLAAGPGPLFSSARGGWLDPSSVAGWLRIAFDACGYEWLTSRMLRHTVGTHLDRAGLPVTATADQLGNTPAVVEKHYRQKRGASNTDAAAALESIREAK